MKKAPAIIAWPIIIGLLVLLGLTMEANISHYNGHYAASAYAARAQARVQRDPRYKHVTVTEFSANGSVRVAGSVESREDLEVLHAFIKQTRPPTNVQVGWWVRVDARTPSAATSTQAAP